MNKKMSFWKGIVELMTMVFYFEGE